MIHRIGVITIGIAVVFFGQTALVRAQLGSIGSIAIGYDENNGTVVVFYEDVSDDNQTDPVTVEELYLGLEYKRHSRGKFRPLPVGYFKDYPYFESLGDTNFNGFDEYEGDFYYHPCDAAAAELGNDLSAFSFRLVATLEVENRQKVFRHRESYDCTE